MVMGDVATLKCRISKMLPTKRPPEVATLPPSQTEMSTLGKVTWLSSCEDSGPDCGIALGLGNRTMIVAGEISEDLYRSGDAGAKALGSSGGWWLTIWGGSGLYHSGGEVLAKFVDAEAAREFMDRLGDAVRCRE